MLEVGLASRFHAVHGIPVGGPTGDLAHHEHDYRVEAVVRGERLPETGMLLDLDELDQALRACLEELDGADLDELPSFAGRVTTVEVVALQIWDRVRARIPASGAIKSLRVTVFESPDAWASVERDLDS